MDLRRDDSDSAQRVERRIRPLWDSPQLNSVTIAAKTRHPHLSASPLYVDRVTLTAGDYAGGTFHVVYAGSSNGFVYAVNARMVKKSVLTENKGDLKSPHSGVTLLCYRMWL